MTIFQAFTNFLWIPLAHDVAYDNASTITRDMETLQPNNRLQAKQCDHVLANTDKNTQTHQSTEYPLDTIANPVHLI